MPSYVAAFALQQLRDMEQLQQNSGRRRTRRRRRGKAQYELMEPGGQVTVTPAARSSSIVRSSSPGARLTNRVNGSGVSTS